MCIRNLVVFAFITLTTGTARPQDSTMPKNQVSVLAFNIFHGATMNGDYNLDIIAGVINQASPHMAALQEVHYKTQRVGHRDITTQLAYKTGMASIFGRAIYIDGGEYGNAILSKFTFIGSRIVPLPFTPGYEERVALEVLCVLPSGDTIAFVGTHLDHHKEDTDRLAQAKKINEVFSQNKYPTLLVGDLNDVPGSGAIRIFESLWAPAYGQMGPQPTFPSSNPERKIDYVMFFPKNRWKVIKSEVIQDKIASDHCPLLVTLELLPE